MKYIIFSKKIEPGKSADDTLHEIFAQYKKPQAMIEDAASNIHIQVFSSKDRAKKVNLEGSDKYYHFAIEVSDHFRSQGGDRFLRFEEAWLLDVKNPPITLARAFDRLGEKTIPIEFHVCHFNDKDARKVIRELNGAEESFVESKEGDKYKIQIVAKKMNDKAGLNNNSSVYVIACYSDDKNALANVDSLMREYPDAYFILVPDKTTQIDVVKYIQDKKSDHLAFGPNMLVDFKGDEVEEDLFDSFNTMMKKMIVDLIEEEKAELLSTSYEESSSDEELSLSKESSSESQSSSSQKSLSESSSFDRLIISDKDLLNSDTLKKRLDFLFKYHDARVGERPDFLKKVLESNDVDVLKTAYEHPFFGRHRNDAKTREGIRKGVSKMFGKQPHEVWRTESQKEIKAKMTELSKNDKGKKKDI